MSSKSSSSRFKDLMFARHMCKKALTQNIWQKIIYSETESIHTKDTEQAFLSSSPSSFSLSSFYSLCSLYYTVYLQCILIHSWHRMRNFSPFFLFIPESSLHSNKMSLCGDHKLKSVSVSTILAVSVQHKTSLSAAKASRSNDIYQVAKLSS